MEPSNTETFDYTTLDEMRIATLERRLEDLLGVAAQQQEQIQLLCGIVTGLYDTDARDVAS